VLEGSKGEKRKKVREIDRLGGGHKLDFMNYKTNQFHTKHHIKEKKEGSKMEKGNGEKKRSTTRRPPLA